MAGLIISVLQRYEDHFQRSDLLQARKFYGLHLHSRGWLAVLLWMLIFWMSLSMSWWCRWCDILHMREACLRAYLNSSALIWAACDTCNAVYINHMHWGCRNAMMWPWAFNIVSLLRPCSQASHGNTMSCRWLRWHPDLLYVQGDQTDLRPLYSDDVTIAPDLQILQFWQMAKL